MSSKTSDALKLEGIAHAQNNQPLKAKDCFERALAINPNDAAALSNLGIVLGTLGEVDAAIAAFHRAIALQPSYKTAYLNLALTQHEQGQSAAAIDSFLTVIALDPTSFQAYCMLSAAYFQLKQFNLALGAIEQALALRPTDTHALHNKSSMLTMLGRPDEAIQVLHHILALEPSHPTARYHLAKFGHGAMPSTAPSSYVTDLFNEYAATFDDQLVTKLQYQAPQQIGLIVQKLNFPSQQVRALDLGCGTGLVAEQIAEPNMHWVGVDLSKKMIDVAAQKRIYSELYYCAIEDYLAQPHESFHLITSADVFIYVGELAKVFQLAYSQLADNGWFVFSVETSVQLPLVLRPSGRFAHSEAYVQQLAISTGFTVTSMHPQILRFDGSTPIEGAVFALQK